MLEKAASLVRTEMGTAHGRVLLAKLLLAPIPSFSGFRTRAVVLRLIGFKLGPGVMFYDFPRIFGPGNIYERLIMAGHNIIGWGVSIDLSDRVTLEKNAGLGPKSAVITSGHSYGDAESRVGQLTTAPVFIGEGAWVGMRSMILPGNSVGRGAVVAAGAVVTKDVPAHTLVAGIPARTIRELDPGLANEPNGRQ